MILPEAPMLVTASLLTATFCLPFVVGLPLAWLLARRRPLSEGDWAAAPFLGLAGVILPLLELTYLGVPVRRAAPWFWLAVLAAYIAWAARGGLAASLRRAPARLLLACAAVYLFHALGACWVGPDYLGRAKGDQVNYNAIAQLLADRSTDATVADATRDPCASVAITLKDDRIGQSVLHALLAVSTGQPPSRLFFPLILLCPPLSLLALEALARRLGCRPPAALLAAAAGAVMPAVAAVTLEAYLSQALLTPFLLFLPACAQALIDRPGWPSLARLALPFVAASTIYPEFLSLLVGLLALQLGGAAALGLLSWRRAVGSFAAALLSLLGLGFALTSLLQPLRRITLDMPNGSGFHRAFSELRYQVWLGDLQPCLLRATGDKVLETIVIALATSLTAVAALALAVTAAAGLRRGRDRAGALLAATLVAALALPLAVRLVNPKLPYQAWKVGLTVAPLLSLGLAVLTQAAARRWPSRRPEALAAAALLFAAWGTFLMHREAAADEVGFQSFAGPCQDESAQAAHRWLARGEPTDWILSAGGDRGATSRTAVLCQRHRRHRFWVLPARLHEQWLGAPGEPAYGDLEAAPAEANYLVGGHNGFRVASPGDADLIDSQAGLAWWALRGGRWCVPVAVRDGEGVELPLRGRQSPPSQTWAIEVVARCAGEIELRATWGAGGAEPAELVVTASGRQTRQVVTPGDLTFRVRVPEGRRQITASLRSPGGARGLFPLGAVGFSFSPDTGP
jgi:hypothetical protein